MAKRLKLYFATDIHGSEKCFRKFLNAAAAYGPDVMVLGGDIAGKAVQAIDDLGDGPFRTTFRGTTYEIGDAEELARVERLISDLGYYPWRAQPGELDRRVADGSVDQVLDQLMMKRLDGWMALAEERLRPRGTPVYWMLGNDDPPFLAEVLERAPWGTHAEGCVLDIGGYSLVSWGYSNRTPWDSYREEPEDELTRHYEELF